MSVQICPECGFDNDKTAVVCKKCGIALNASVQRHKNELSPQDLDVTIHVVDELFTSLETQIPEAPSTTHEDDTAQSDDKIDTPVETDNISIKSDHDIKTQFGILKVLGSLTLTHEKSQTQFRFQNQQLNEIVIGRKNRQISFVPTIDLSSLDGRKKGVSRRHATMIHKNGLMMLIDHHSVNGTYINGQRVTPEQARIIRDKDTIRFGMLTLHVKYSQ